MPKDVKCSVSSCEYWTSGNGCSAKEIEVNHNESTSPYMEVGEIGDTGTSGAKTSNQTCCRTMKPKANR